MFPENPKHTLLVSPLLFSYWLIHKWSTASIFLQGMPAFYFFSEFCFFDNEHLGLFFQCDCSIACLESRVWKTIDQIVAHLIHSRVPSKNTGIYRSFQHVARSVVSMPKAQKHSKLQCFGSCHALKKQKKSTKECPKWTFQTLVSKPVSIRVTQPKNVKTLATKHCK